MAVHHRPRHAHYQAGVGGPYLNITHAMRPDGAADPIGERATLCGATVRPSPRPFYAHDTRPHMCRTCGWIAGRFPPERPIEPLADIGTATALFGMLRGARHAPEDELREQVDQVLASFPMRSASERDWRVAEMTSH
jgi:hypothetical protein